MKIVQSIMPYVELPTVLKPLLFVSKVHDHVLSMPTQVSHLIFVLEYVYLQKVLASKQCE